MDVEELDKVDEVRVFLALVCADEADEEDERAVAEAVVDDEVEEGADEAGATGGADVGWARVESDLEGREDGVGV